MEMLNSFRTPTTEFMGGKGQTNYSKNILKQLVGPVDTEQMIKSLTMVNFGEDGTKFSSDNHMKN
jgi:hypothetical protein